MAAQPKHPVPAPPLARPMLSLVATLLALALAPAPVHALLVHNPAGSYGNNLFGGPSGIAIDADDASYVVSGPTRRVEKFSRGGKHLFGWGIFGYGPGQFEFPGSIAIAPGGEVLVLDVSSGRIQVFSPVGGYMWEFGSTGSGFGQFNSPHGIAVRADGTIYVADTYNHRVQKFTAGGSYLGQWGGYGSAPGQFNTPYGIAVDVKGHVYVSDTYNHRVQKFTGDGVLIASWGSQGTGDGQFTFPNGLNVDRGGNVYVTDTNNHRIQRFTSTGVFVAKWGSLGGGAGELVVPQGVATTRAGDLHVADTGNDRIQTFRSRNGTGHETLLAWGSSGSGNGEFMDVRGIGVAADGFVYVADAATDRIQKFTEFGAWGGVWGTSGAGVGQLSLPTGVAVAPDGNVYVAETGNSRVQVFTPGGAHVAMWGSAGSGAGQFSGAWDIAIDGDGNVYVTDANRVQKFTLAGAFVAQWSSPGAAGVGTDADGFVYVASLTDDVVRRYHPDGSLERSWGGLGSNPGQFYDPTDVVVDTAGYVYVSDGADHIHQFTPLGGYVAGWGSSGSALRQLGLPLMLAVDPHGNVFASEFANRRVQKFASPPELMSIANVLNDDGRYATVTFTRTSAETPLSGAPPTEYLIHRYDTSTVPPSLVLVATVPADGVTTTAIVDLGASATATLTGMVEVWVRVSLAVPGAMPLMSWNYGFAVDDVAPQQPDPFTAAWSPSGTAIHWPASPATDLAEYRLHRDVTPGFTLTPANLIHASADTGYVDPGPTGFEYQLVAVDTSGNASTPAMLSPTQVADVPGDESLSFALDEITPNPLHGKAAVVRFVLPDARPARLELVDVAGRVRSAREVAGAGPHAVSMGAARGLPAGIYFVRLSHAGRALVRRTAVLP